MIGLNKKRAIIKVFGIVQGVGFRPFIHKLVNSYMLKGWVQNSTCGVTIDIEGEEECIRNFVRNISEAAPAMAVIENVTVEFKEVRNYRDFKIEKSNCNGNGFVLISPDISICKDCFNELTDPLNKRYRYPFINCTNCGPRFTIIKDLPYDRDKTTMSEFLMCDDCRHEYEDIDNRRYHAQPNCCPECGPKLWLCDRKGNELSGDPIKEAVKKLEEGSIVAIKGLGGFHLACNGLDSGAVIRLRKSKHREQKPFALMCKDIKSIKNYAYVSSEEQKILECPRKPIVLLKKITGCAISPEIAPDTRYLGFMLPYTPLHCLLFQDGGLDVLVMTSANISDNPIVFKNSEAVSTLNNIADYFLLHNREINTRCDDSVVKVVEGREYFIRRSRGYAPFPIKMYSELKPILACGGEQKASFCISRGKYVFLSQHIGDLKNYATLIHYEEQIDNFKRLFKVEPHIIACDMHPDYLSTWYAQHNTNVDKVYVQHHHAHLASCMADNNLDGEAIGITWDGSGLGADGTIWGGEILKGGYSGFERKGTFLKARMPGGDRAVKNIYIMALSYIFETYGDNFLNILGALKHIKDIGDDFELLRTMLKRGINSPYTSSCGRLFDGVSSMLGLLNDASYEGQGAVKLEAASNFDSNDSLDYAVIKSRGMYIYDWRPTIDSIICMIKSGRDLSYIASAFHNTIVRVGVRQCELIRDETGLDRVVLSGGVFQNNILLYKISNELRVRSFKVYIHGRVSANDEGLSLGQLMVAQNGGGMNVPGGSFKDSFNTR